MLCSLALPYFLLLLLLLDVYPYDRYTAESNTINPAIGGEAEDALAKEAGALTNCDQPARSEITMMWAPTHAGSATYM